jgi:hypothetical protein
MLSKTHVLKVLLICSLSTPVYSSCSRGFQHKFDVFGRMYLSSELWMPDKNRLNTSNSLSYHYAENLIFHLSNLCLLCLVKASVYTNVVRPKAENLSY